MASDIAHNHWQLGEKYAAKGQYLEALLHYEKARGLTDSTTSTYKKYTDCHGRIVNILQKNPVLALQLHRGFSKKDVRKAYRRCVLIYHPDKNSDCDTSTIFTIIQSAYEELIASAPDELKSELPTVQRAEMQRMTKSDLSNYDNAYFKTETATEFRANTKEPPHVSPLPLRKEDKRPHFFPSEEGLLSTERGQASAHVVTTEELREKLHALRGQSEGGSLDSMNRGELMREYLLHVRRDVSNERGSRPGRRLSMQEENRYLSQWMDAIRSVLGKESDKIGREVQCEPLN